MTKQREHWGSKLGFIMATAGSAIGLGSLWRFPYIAGDNGGGAFVFLYLLFTLFIGIPAFIAELVMGRRAQKSVVGAFSNLAHKSENWKMAGWLNIATSFLILSYYSVIAGWGLNYAFMSINQFSSGKSAEEIRGVFDIMYTSPDINILWHFIFMLLTVGVVFGGIRKGIEYWSKILTPALMVILGGLFIYALTLEGFGEAARFVLWPDFSKLTPRGILDALGMSFFTLSVGLGIVTTYGSYMTRKEDIPGTSFIIGVVSVLVSLFAALMIFPIVFSFGFTPEAGPGLVFKTLPVLFEQLPGTLIISTVFFVLFVFTALTSSISLLEVLVANLMEVLLWTRKKAVLIAGIACFIVGIPSALSGSGSIFPEWKAMYGTDFFGTLDYITGSWMMPIGGLLSILFVGWFIDKKAAKEEFLFGVQMKWFLGPWLLLLRWVAPIAILIIILQEGEIIDINSLFNLGNPS